MITLNSNPGSYYSAHGDLIFVVSSDNSDETDFKYIADIYVNGDLQVRLKRVPNPGTEFGVFNIGDIVRNYILTKLNPTANALRAQELSAGEFYVDVQVKFGEEYGGTLYTNVLTDSSRRYYNHYNGQMIGGQTILPNYSNKVASNRPYSVDIDFADDFVFIPYFPLNSNPIAVKVTKDNGANVTFNVTPTSGLYLQILNVSPAVVNSLSPGFITGSTLYYTVQFGTTSVYKFNIECSGRYETVRLHFLNKLGGFESKNFNKISRKNISIEKQGYSVLPYLIDGAGAVSYYTANKVYNDIAPIYFSSYNEQMVLNSDFISDDEYTWLQELLVSPRVYIEQNGYFIPVDITERTYEVRKQVNDKLTNITITVTTDANYNAQQL